MADQTVPRPSLEAREAEEKKFSEAFKAIVAEHGFTAVAADYHDVLLTRFSWKVASGEMRASGCVLNNQSEISLTWVSPWTLVYTVLESIPPFCFITPFISSGKVELKDHAKQLTLDQIRERIGLWMKEYPPKP